MVPRGTETEGGKGGGEERERIGTPCQLDLKTREREGALDGERRAAGEVKDAERQELTWRQSHCMFGSREGGGEGR